MTALRVALFAWLSVPLIAFGQSAYPSKSIRLIVPYPPGGAVDTVARPIAQKMGELIAHPVVIDNRPGAQTIIGSDIVAKSAPDGYTLLLAFSAHITLPFFSKAVPYDPVRDFTPITIVAKVPNVLVVHPSLGVNSVKELVEYARKNPGKLSYATAGAGTAHHLAGELLNIAAKIDLVHVPYKGGAPALNELLGGQIQTGFLVLSTALPHARSGKLRALGMIEATRAKAAPEIPTIAEGGIPGYEVPETWAGFLGPAAMPPAIVSRIHAEIRNSINAPEVRARLEGAGFEVTGTTPEQFASAITRDTEIYRKIVTAAGIKPE